MGPVACGPLIVSWSAMGLKKEAASKTSVGEVVHTTPHNRKRRVLTDVPERELLGNVHNDGPRVTSDEVQ